MMFAAGAHCVLFFWRKFCGGYVLTPVCKNVKSHGFELTKASVELNAEKKNTEAQRTRRNPTSSPLCSLCVCVSQIPQPNMLLITRHNSCSINRPEKSIRLISATFLNLLAPALPADKLDSVVAVSGSISTRTEELSIWCTQPLSGLHRLNGIQWQRS